MAMEGMKSGTRDLDVIVADAESHRILVHSLNECGYTEVQSQDLNLPYQKLSATALQNTYGLRWEIFIKVVGKKLSLSNSMKGRASTLHSGDFLMAYGISREDIFLLKAMTERERDLEDMSLIAKSGIDYEVVFEECVGQSEINGEGHIWEASLNEKLKELEEQYGVYTPIRKKLEKIAEEKMLITPIKRVLSKKNLTLEEISAELPELSVLDIKDGLEILINSGTLLRLDDGKYSLKKPGTG